MSDLPIEVVDINKLELHPKNPRAGDIGAIVESITENEWYGTITVQRSTNRILAGNHRVKALQEMGVTEVPVWYVDVDDVKAAQILLADNRANDKANYNQKELADLLVELAEKQALTGTLYDGDDLDRLLKDLSQPLDTDWADAFDREDEQTGSSKNISFSYDPEYDELVKGALATTGETNRNLAFLVMCRKCLG